jgi:hypothetical protein
MSFEWRIRGAWRRSGRRLAALSKIFLLRELHNALGLQNTSRVPEPPVCRPKEAPSPSPERWPTSIRVVSFVDVIGSRRINALPFYKKILQPARCNPYE